MRYGVRKKKELVLWGILCVGLILLYLLSSTDWIIKEKRGGRSTPVSLIISDTSMMITSLPQGRGSGGG